MTTFTSLYSLKLVHLDLYLISFCLGDADTQFQQPDHKKYFNF